jgi:hypothetical protein
MFILALLAAGGVLAGCSLQPSQLTEDGPPTDGVVVREAWTNRTLYRQIVRDGSAYVVNVEEQSSIFLRYVSGEPKPVMQRIAAAPAVRFGKLEGTEIVDPASLDIGIRKSIPYTYEALPDQAFVYLETLLQDGWEITSYYSDASFIDYYLKKDEIFLRVLIFEKNLKVLYPIQGKQHDPWTFISD